MRCSETPLDDAISACQARRLTPEAALMLCLLLLRGGNTSRGVIYDDYDEWVQQHGEPTWPKVEAWAVESEMEAVIAMSVFEQRKAAR